MSCDRSEVPTQEDKVTGWANWALMGNDALFPHQIPETLRPLHDRIKKAVRGALKEAKLLKEQLP